MSAVSKEVEIRNHRGLHARASAKFVTLASQMEARITVSKDGSEVAGTSIMGLMMLGAAKGDSIVIAAEGDNHEEALQQLVDLIEAKFGED